MIDSNGDGLVHQVGLSCVGRCPRLVAANVSMLIGHLGGKAYSLRSAIITALGHLVHKAFERIPGEDADAQGALPQPHPASWHIAGP